MRALLRDIREHKVAAVLLLVWWIALMAAATYAEVYRWANPDRDPPFGIANLFVFAFPFVAAIVAGWWRATALASPTALKSGSWLGPSIVSSLLAALISSVAAELVAWGFDEVVGPLIAGGDWPAPGPGEGYTVVGVYLTYGLLVVVFGVLGGFLGGFAASMYWSDRGSGRDGKPA